MGKFPSPGHGVARSPFDQTAAYLFDLAAKADRLCAKARTWHADEMQDDRGTTEVAFELVKARRPFSWGAFVRFWFFTGAFALFAWQINDRAASVALVIAAACVGPVLRAIGQLGAKVSTEEAALLHERLSGRAQGSRQQL